VGNEKLQDGVPLVDAVNGRAEVRSYTAICMNCHNTMPYAYRIFHGMFVGYPHGTVAAALEPLSRALADTVQVAPTVEGFTRLNAGLDPDQHLVTLGISCESCHLGGREHAKHEKEIRFLPTSPLLKVKDHDPAKPLSADRRNPRTVLGLCTQCHSGVTYYFPNGGAIGNSCEGFDMQKGFCTTQLHCAHCHEPHTATDRPSGSPLDPKHVAACVQCHSQYAEPEQALAHAKHPADSQVNCLDCHMPRYIQGVDELSRSHRISHPVEESMVRAGSANACNTCHLDKSLRWTLEELDKGWGRRITPQQDWPAHAKLDEPVGPLWLQGPNNHLRLLAAQCYGRSPLGPAMLPELIRALNDPEPLNRAFHQCAIQRVRGKPLHEPIPVEITETPARRREQIEDWLKALRTK
jgi:hypothetical protein